MHPDIIQLIEFGTGLVMVLGIVGCTKLIVWDLPRRRFRRFEHRVEELDERFDQVLDALSQQNERLEEYHERLDFGERLLTRNRPEPATPV
jgi:hypothetical protein